MGRNKGIVFQTALKSGFIYKLYVNSKMTLLAGMGLGKVPQITGTRDQSSATVPQASAICHKQGQTDLGRGSQTLWTAQVFSASLCQGKQNVCPGAVTLPAWRETEPQVQGSAWPTLTGWLRAALARDTISPPRLKSWGQICLSTPKLLSCGHWQRGNRITDTSAIRPQET